MLVNINSANLSQVFTTMMTPIDAAFQSSVHGNLATVVNTIAILFAKTWNDTDPVQMKNSFFFRLIPDGIEIYIKLHYAVLNKTCVKQLRTYICDITLKKVKQKCI